MRYSTLSKSKGGPPNYYWDGVHDQRPKCADGRALLAGHEIALFYNEYVSFQDGSQPVKAATSTIACQLRQG